MIYAYQRYGTSQQYSVAHAMEDLNISTEHLSAHNAYMMLYLRLIYVRS